MKIFEIHSLVSRLLHTILKNSKTFSDVFQGALVKSKTQRHNTQEAWIPVPREYPGTEEHWRTANKILETVVTSIFMGEMNVPEQYTEIESLKGSDSMDVGN